MQGAAAMLKSIGFITIKPGMAEAAFHHHWREVHGPLALRIRSLRRYVQAIARRTPSPVMNNAPTPALPRDGGMIWRPCRAWSPGAGNLRRKHTAL